MCDKAALITYSVVGKAGWRSVPGANSRIFVTILKVSLATTAQDIKARLFDH
jgi:hypothetical protein